MALPQYIIRRGNKLHYRRAYPKELWPVTGKAPFSRSLRTDSLSVACRARPAAERDYWEAVDQARAKLARIKDHPPLTNADAEALAASWLRRSLATWEEYQDRPIGHPKLQEELEQAADWEAEAREELAADRWPLIRRGRELAREAGYGPDENAEFYLGKLLGRAKVASWQVIRRRLVGDYSDRPDDPFFAAVLTGPPPASPPAVVKPSRTLSDLVGAFEADRWPKLAKATHRAQGTAFEAALDILGLDTPLALIGRDEGRKLFDAIQRIPRNRGKVPALRGLSLEAAMVEAERLGLPPIAPKTINDSYLGHLKSLFAWAVREQWMTSNPLSGLSVPDPVPDADKRCPFGADLPTLFGGPPWHPQDTSAGGHPILYWGPLLGLFMGLRLGEVASLASAALTMDRGHPVLDVRGTKAAASRRKLVVHPVLVRLGFVAMCEARKATGEAQLFAGERADSKGNWGRKLGERFKRLVKARGLGGRKLTFHSLRHDFEDALREAGLHGTPIGAYLAGRAPVGGVAAAYGAGFSTEAKADAIAKVSYPVLPSLQ